jgi:hypothetical protein
MRSDKRLPPGERGSFSDAWCRVGKSRTDGLDFHIYGIHEDTVTLEVLDGVVKKVKDNALSYPRRSRNMRVRLCKFNAMVERKRSLPEAEVIDRIRGSFSPTIASAGARSYLGSKRPLLRQLPLRECVKGSWQPAWPLRDSRRDSRRPLLQLQACLRRLLQVSFKVSRRA